MENYFNASKEQFQEFMALPIDKPLQMVNLLKFKSTVEESGISGEEQYNIYMKAALPFIKQSNAKVVWYGKAQFTLIGPTDTLEWDKIIIVEYATKSDFINMVMQKDYPNHLRVAALSDARLIFCTKV